MLNYFHTLSIMSFFKFKGYKKTLEKINQLHTSPNEKTGNFSYRHHIALSPEINVAIALSKRGKTYYFNHNDRVIFTVFDGIYMPHLGYETNEETYQYIQRLKHVLKQLL